MFDDSEPQQISHPLQQIKKQEDASWQYAPKNVTRRVNHWVARPDSPPIHLASVINTRL